jgi:tetratricopeptide (TPR) repeat protein
MAQGKAGEDEAAAATLRTAVAAKLAARDDAGLLTALLELSTTLGYDLGRDKEAAPWLELAEATIDRTGRKPRDVARLLLTRATIDVQAQRFEAAEAQLLTSTALLTEQLGPDHPSLSNHLNSLGAVHLRTGKYAEAQAQFERAVALAETAGGPNHPDVAFPLNNLALGVEGPARDADAIATLQRALELIERTSGADHPNVGLLRQNIGGMLRLAGKLPAARAELDQGLKILEAKLGPEHPMLGHALTLSGDIALDQADHARARADYERSDALRRKALGEDHPELAEARPAEAAAALEKALALMATTQPDPIDRAEVQLNLARALPPSERTRARTLASEARAEFLRNGVRAARYVPEVDAWLAANPNP